jgi:serine/threonine-protein kinase RsbW
MGDTLRRQTESVERSVDSTLESVDRVEEIAVHMAQKSGFSEDELMKIGLAVRECMVNAVVHGNRYSANKKVRIALHRTAERLTVRISDEGEGFEYEHVPNPLAPENLLRSSGRGLFLIRSFMDEFQVRRREEGGTEVILVKYTA